MNLDSSGEFSLPHVESQQNAVTFESAVVGIIPEWREKGAEIQIHDPDEAELYQGIQEDEFREGDIVGAMASEQILTGIQRDKMQGIARREVQLYGDDFNLIIEASGEITTLALRNHGTIDGEHSDKNPETNPARRALRRIIGSQAEDTPTHLMRVVYKF
ncbi:hypothetical protein A2961_03190 [Candidatus Woesebacteria bacterium RIFCSPLOWO2_01_FULL_39_21]|uniref:Uncharacterized protein n=1 Tax=Candidatus Woesebacteria bacterium RIFCSPLOWO2_01_FULL_39_21 TaxID=1802519 RepID=A0A1F8BHD4_9BACT|nr:MAG: hypothetical protein A2691_02640 [Candidatus Woesebacteria bacterium RIFCSPHIGHO2_01_FULL_39_23]OGM63443.1 MAG: hypothetical protein A2961_03190 [Candidatus Woesebacteria bacterium RIFCSPLOWO2_01_FULL_39_21]